MNTAAVWKHPIMALAPEIQSGRLSPVELLDVYLDRIARHDDRLGAYVRLSARAREAAEQAEAEIEAGKWRGPLHGIPIAVKDNFGTVDMPTLAGSEGVEIDWPLQDATAVSRLRAAGAIIIGKTRMHEFAWGMETPPTVNPWDYTRVPGGSSGGSGAAVAGGLCAAALGSDTGGSIRIPASLCGCVGVKPTFGVIGRTGMVPHSWSLDHAGPICASVADAALLTSVLAGPDALDPGSTSREGVDYSDALQADAQGLRVGLCRNHFFEGLTEDVSSAVEESIDALAHAGAEIIEFEVPELAAGLGAIFAIELASSSNYHDQRIRNGSVRSFAPDVRLLVEMGRLVSAADYLQAERLRRLLGDRFAAAFENVDVVLSPTMPMTAWKVDERFVRIGGREESVLAMSWRLTFPWNLLGAPTISVPCGQDGSGLPIGAQISAAPFGEAAMFRAAAALENLSRGTFPRVSLNK